MPYDKYTHNSEKDNILYQDIADNEDRDNECYNLLPSLRFIRRVVDMLNTHISVLIGLSYESTYEAAGQAPTSLKRIHFMGGIVYLYMFHYVCSLRTREWQRIRSMRRAILTSAGSVVLAEEMGG